jgi:DNA excision repair protein ERCC-3
LVQSQHESYDAARQHLMTIAELVQRVDPIHVYQIRPISLWQAAASGLSAREVLQFLRTFAAHPVPYALQQLVLDEMTKWGRLTLHRGGRQRVVLRGSPADLSAVRDLPAIGDILLADQGDGLVFRLCHRAEVKRVLAQNGRPVYDVVGYQDSPSLAFQWNAGFRLRDYQAEAVERFLANPQDQSGVVVLPCGAGKTTVGIAAMQRLGRHALILTPSETSAMQWQRELLNHTSLTEAEVGLYEPGRALRPVTITTYQRVAARNAQGERVHLRRLTSHPWGIVVYDEVHMLPAPLFRLAADLQGARRLGLTATLVREDGAEADVFSLIGGKVYEVPWKQLEQAGYLAAVRCVEVRVPLDPAAARRYAASSARERHRIAALNPAKFPVVKALLEQHRGDSVLVIGHYLDSLRELALQFGCPLICGQTPQAEREHWLQQFREGKVRRIVLSRVANMAIDLPCASVAIQVSGLFGSRQEEAQRLGRLLRPETKEGVFYTLVSQNTVEERTARHRQLYLVEQGYAYSVCEARELADCDDAARYTSEEEVP